MMRRNFIAGFTLLELLIAIAVFSVLAIMSYGTLSNVLRAQNQTSEAAEKLHRIQQAMLYLERDLLQIVKRPTRTEFGSWVNTLVGDEFGKFRLEFTRTGYPNPNLAPRSYLQRISYVMPEDEENKLYRYVWSSLDGGTEQDARKLLLLDDVEELVLRFYDNQGEDGPKWPPDASTGTPPTFDVMPRAIKIVIKTKSMGEIWRLFEIPGA